jgi:diaminopropionate ammonia-lyase
MSSGTGRSSERVRWRRNPYRGPATPAAILPEELDGAAFHRSLPGYAPTPLVAFPALAGELGIGELWVKDEGRRLGLDAFKVLGAAYAIHRVLAEAPRGGAERRTFATATDGNHGRAVAWTARVTGQRAVVFVPGHTVPARIAAIRGEGAEVVVVDGTYDDAVRQAAAESARHGWQVISDTAYPGYLEIPRWIMAGYETIFREAAEQLGEAGRGGPDVVLLQAGVGGFAGSGASFYARRAAGGPGATRPRLPRLVVVEPTDADCLLESIASPGGELSEGRGGQRSIMAGLNCGLPSLVAWPVLRATVDLFLAVDDAFAEEAMRRLASGAGGAPRVVAGESGAAGLAGLLALCGEAELAAERAALGLDRSARVLLVNTEGATDPVGYRRIVGVAP